MKERREAIRYWWRMAREALAAAELALKAGFLHTAVNRAYYAAFYAVTALLLTRDLQFKKHSGVRAAFHREFVRTGLVSKEIGALYDELFEERQHSDYLVLVELERDEVRERIDGAKRILEVIEGLLNGEVGDEEDGTG